jgi:hypothetical protein
MNKRTQLLEVIADLPEELVDQALNYAKKVEGNCDSCSPPSAPIQDMLRTALKVQNCR